MCISRTEYEIQTHSIKMTIHDQNADATWACSQRTRPFFLSCNIPARKVCVTRFIKPCPYSDTQKEWIPTKIYAVWFYTSCWTSQGVSIEKSTAHRHGRQRGQISAPFKWNDGHESHMESVKKVTQFNNLYVIIIVWVLSVPVMLPFTDLNLRALDLVQ